MLYEFVHPRKHIKEVPFYHLLPDDNVEMVQEHLDEFFNMMYERQEIWYKRNVQKLSPPWSKDEILSNYRFTNIYRELDKSSQFLIKNVLSNDKLDINEIVFQTFIYRYFNKPDCFTDGLIDLPSYYDFDANKLWQQVKNCREKHYNPWHTAYMSNLVWAKKEDFEGGLFKDFAYCMRLFPKFHEFTPAFADRILNESNVSKLMKSLESLPSISGFMSHEFFLDYCYLNKYNSNYSVNFDENSYTNVGPGASLGIKLIFPSLEPKSQLEAIYLLRDVAESCLSGIGDFKYVSWDKSKKEYIVSDNFNITLHQIEFLLCEFSKYWKMKIGLGKQRSKFIPNLT